MTPGAVCALRAVRVSASGVETPSSVGIAQVSSSLSEPLKWQRHFAFVFFFEYSRIVPMDLI